MKIAFFTTTRAEFGLLLPLIKSIERSKKLDYLLFAGGAHLSQEYGHTMDEIESAGVKVSATFDYMPSRTQPTDLLKALALETGQLADIFSIHGFDAVCILGDRYELIPVVQAAILFKKIIIHIHGGEKSEGVIDEQIRHMITKAAHLHFAARQEYAGNIRKMGEQEWRVHNTGALVVDNITNLVPIPRKELFADLNLREQKNTVLLTFHPVKAEDGISIGEQIRNLFDALNSRDYQLMITAPGADPNREIILDVIAGELKNNPDYHFRESLGLSRYLSLVPQCRFVIGNSSSGIIEVPWFRIPTINIGSRQQGRIQHPSVIDTACKTTSIIRAIEKAESDQFRSEIANMKYQFGDGHAAEKMKDILENQLQREDILVKKLDL